MTHPLWLGAYLLVIAGVACYGLYRYHLLWLYACVRRHPMPPPVMRGPWPTVTIQIPVYNERYVIARAIHAACRVDYPRDRLEIQLLDDSTDQTSQIIAQTIAPYQAEGVRLAHLRRSARHGYKAGALQHGLERASGELLAVFDADFVIPPDFLTRTVPHFADARVGVVQARWGHLNANSNWLTKAQALFLDGHFLIEQVARHRGQRFLNFNGTAGIWRAEAIRSAGGWHADTLTEDLDLSYRAQLAGWRCVFLPELVVPAELPVEIEAFKTQQYRWTKGSIQTAKKLAARLITAPLPWRLKLGGFFHLTIYLMYPLGLLAGLGLPFVLASGWRLRWIVEVCWIALLVLPAACFYLCAKRRAGAPPSRALAAIVWAIAVGVGVSVNNARAVLDGFWGHSHEFLRTPKFCLQAVGDQWRSKLYRAVPSATVWWELLLALYFAGGVAVAYAHRAWLALPCLAVCAVGLAYVGGGSLWQQRGRPAWSFEPTLQSLHVPS